MPDQIRCEFQVTLWQEETVEVAGSTKITQAKVAYLYPDQNDSFTGESTVNYLMAYADGESSEFVGIERFNGCLAGHTGGFALRHTGRYRAREKVSQAEFVVVGGSGTGELQGISGTGEVRATHNGETEFVFNFELGGSKV